MKVLGLEDDSVRDSQGALRLDLEHLPLVLRVNEEALPCIGDDEGLR